MKICLVNTNKSWGGGEKWHYHTALELVKNGHEITMIVYPKSPLAKVSREFFEVLEFKIGKRSFLNPFTYQQLKKVFNNERFDAVLMNLPSDVKAFSKPAAEAGIKKIIYRRGMNHPIKASLFNKYFYQRFVTDIIANSEAVRRSIFKFLPQLEDKITVIPNGVDASIVFEHVPARADKILVGNLGRLVVQKGQFDLIELGKKIKQTEINFHIFIGGEGPLRKELEERIKLAGLTDHITLLGEVQPADFFAQIDYFVFPSRFEGMSNAMLEALHFGKPILCYDVASNSEIVEDGKNGFLVEPYDVEMMKTRLIDLHGKPDVYCSMQEKGQKVLDQNFDSKMLYRKLEKLIAGKD